MKILIINASDIGGGAARATYRLHKALLSQGINSIMLVQSKVSDDYTVIGPKTKLQKAIAKIRPIIDSLPVRLYRNRPKMPFSPAWVGFSKIVKKIKTLKPDIVHLHWICGGMMRIEDLAKIDIPIVWTLHDNWAFTGGCHVKWKCERYKENCGKCPILGSNRENDLSKKVWNRKKKTFSQIPNMVVVGASKWVTSCAKQSFLFRDKKVVNLPNLIDTTIFKPFDKKKARELWNLPKNKKLILFGAMSATTDINKGFKELSEAMHKLNGKNIELVVFGSSKPQNAPDFGFNTQYVGHLHDDISLVTLYNAVDLTVVPSLQENLSNTIMESLACGIPVVAFDVGGNNDMIENKINGYLAKSFDTDDLKKGIEWVLSVPNYDELCYNSREKVLKEFDSAIVVNKYIMLYEEIKSGA